jgi:hypothetical protein
MCLCNLENTWTLLAIGSTLKLYFLQRVQSMFFGFLWAKQPLRIKQVLDLVYVTKDQIDEGEEGSSNAKYMMLQLGFDPYGLICAVTCSFSVQYSLLKD